MDIKEKLEKFNELGRNVFLIAFEGRVIFLFADNELDIDTEEKFIEYIEVAPKESLNWFSFDPDEAVGLAVSLVTAARSIDPAVITRAVLTKFLEHAVEERPSKKH